MKTAYVGPDRRRGAPGAPARAAASVPHRATTPAPRQTGAPAPRHAATAHAAPRLSPFSGVLDRWRRFHGLLAGRGAAAPAAPAPATASAVAAPAVGVYMPSALQARAQVRRRRRAGVALWRQEAVLAGVALFVIYMVAALLWVYGYSLYVPDGVSRTLHAWQVFFSAQPKLTAVGFVWPPLPTLLQLPLILIPWLKTDGLSGPFLTAVMGGLSGAWLVKILELLGLGRGLRLTLLALFALNPMILFYASNGLSEMTFIAFTLGSLWALLLWNRTESTQPIITLGILLSLAFLSRYDTLVLLVFILIVMAMLAPHHRCHVPGRREAVVIACALPVGATVIFWVLINWIIMGDPLYFAHGQYSLLSLLPYYHSGVTNALAGQPQAVAEFIASEIAQLYPAFLVAAAVLAVDVFATRNRLSLALLLLTLSFPLYQAANLVEGHSEALLRYSILAIPLGVILTAWLLRRLDRLPTSRLVHRLIIGVVVALLLASNVSTVRAMATHRQYGQWNDAFVDALLTGQRVDTCSNEREIAHYLLAESTGRDVLLDDFQGYCIIFFSGRPALFVTNGDRDFRDTVRGPVGRVNFIVVSKTRLEGNLNAINQQWPALFDNGADWATLVGDYPNGQIHWRIYRVNAGADDAASLNAKGVSTR